MYIVCLGDSICYGDGVSHEKAWVSLIANNFTHDVVRNAGLNGDTAEGGLHRLRTLLDDEVPDVLYVQFGLNDAWQQLSVDAYRGCMKEIVHLALSQGVGAVLASTNHGVCVTEEQRLYGGNLFRENARWFNVVLREAFALPPERMQLIDAEAAWDTLDVFTQERLLQADGVHLSEAGNRWYAELMLPYMVNARHQ